jgi:tRNA U34 5-methylaminomethyl-2-thiouridine-forming methyltransferase MnmC
MDEKGEESLHLLEIGFGTGLNALMTQFEAEKHGMRVHYTAIEAFPLEENYWKALNYPYLFGSVDLLQVFTNLHHAAWGKTAEISPHFTIHKVHGSLEAYEPAPDAFDMIYFDAFGPDVQPELWTEQIFGKMYNGLRAGGSLVTYSVKGTVVRALRSSGFSTEKLPGPPGKRHILRAVKL